MAKSETYALFGGFTRDARTLSTFVSICVLLLASLSPNFQTAKSIVYGKFKVSDLSAGGAYAKQLKVLKTMIRS